MKEIVIASVVRTPVGKLLGAFKEVPAVDLGTVAAREAMRRGGVKENEIQEVIIGSTHQEGLRPNPARQISIHAGIPHEVPSMTINKLCGSGLKAMELASLAIKADDKDIILAGGIENMTRVPFLLLEGRWGSKLGATKLHDALFYDGFEDPFINDLMGMTAENVAERFKVNREDQDQFAYESHMKAAAAIEKGRFKEEIVPVEIPQRRGDPVVVDTDECVRADTSIEKLSKLRPAFKKDGTVTAGNACAISDGGSAVVIMSRDKAEDKGLEPMASFLSFASVGVDPAIMGFAPAPAIRKALQKANLGLDDVELFEINEAFASQCLAVIRDLKLNPDIVNVNGGAIALGHPVGATGARLVASLLHEMRRRDLHIGVVSMCIGGGQGIAAVLKRD
jgi:acetyl-CoA C-acetyltransferase